MNNILAKACQLPRYSQRIGPRFLLSPFASDNVSDCPSRERIVLGQECSTLPLPVPRHHLCANHLEAAHKPLPHCVPGSHQMDQEEGSLLFRLLYLSQPDPLHLQYPNFSICLKSSLHSYSLQKDFYPSPPHLHSNLNPFPENDEALLKIRRAEKSPVT